jgi:3-methylfumaryl-CoA hydratase
MTSPTTHVLAEALRGWAPDPVHLTRPVDPWAAAAFADLLDAPPPPLDPGDPLPPLWHWFTLLEHPAHAELGPDGHPADGPFLPPIPRRRRMFAGGRFRQHRPIPVGGELTAHSAVADVTVKTGRTGEMAFVTVRHELSVTGAHIATEEQDIVYRSELDGAARPTRPASASEPSETPPADWRGTLTTDPVRLFRFSALTYNAHRIHYDHPYATEVEGYAGLVVHGPLLALLALELPRLHAPTQTVTEFAYRLVRPATAPARIEATARRDGSALELSVGAEGAGPSLTATATLGDGRYPAPVTATGTEEEGAP